VKFEYSLARAHPARAATVDPGPRSSQRQPTQTATPALKFRSHATPGAEGVYSGRYLRYCAL